MSTSGTNVSSTGTTGTDTVDAKRGTSSDTQGENKKRTDMLSEEEFFNEAYPIKFKQGRALIINNTVFDKLKRKRNTSKDKADLMLRFKELGFDVQAESNLTKQEMIDKIRIESEINHSDSNCFVCVIMSYGEEGTVNGKDGPIQIQELLNYFKGDKCESLAGKPKIFVVQASCIPVYIFEETDARPEAAEMEPVIITRKIPIEADFLIAYSVVPDYMSDESQSVGDGSCFIQALCNVLKSSSDKLDLMTMMTRVNGIVAKDFEDNDYEEFIKQHKRIPSVTSMLTKEFYFKCVEP